MPIRINLLAESLAEEELRRRDPVKRAVFVGALLVALSLVWFSSVRLTFMMQKRSLSSIQNEIQSHTNEFNEVQAELKQTAEARRRLEALQQLTAARFLQGTLLNALQQTHVANVQLTRLQLEQTYIRHEGIASKTNNFGVVPGRPPTMSEQVALTLNARDFSQKQGDEINHFKDALNEQAYFRSNLVPTNGIQLSNLIPQQAGPDSRPYVLFTLQCRFLERIQ